MLCQKKLRIDKISGNVLGGGSGNLDVFGYGSCHDQLGTAPKNPLKKLLQADRMIFYICDECFEKNAHLFQGINLIHTVQTKRVW